MNGKHSKKQKLLLRSLVRTTVSCACATAWPAAFAPVLWLCLEPLTCAALMLIVATPAQHSQQCCVTRQFVNSERPCFLLCCRAGSPALPKVSVCCTYAHDYHSLLCYQAVYALQASLLFSVLQGRTVACQTGCVAFPITPTSPANKQHNQPRPRSSQVMQRAGCVASSARCTWHCWACFRLCCISSWADQLGEAGGVCLYDNHHQQ